MSVSKPFSYLPVLPLLTIIWLSSCSVVPKNYPRNTPFVYEYNINVEGNLSAEEKEKIESGLKNQLDDSIRVRAVNKFFYKGINRPVLENPPVFRSDAADRSVIFMRALLSALGYFKDSITYDTTTRIVGNDQYRTTVNFLVKPGKVVTLDSVNYNIRQQELQNLTTANLNAALVKKGDPFAKATISQELDRLVELYRNNGYMRFSREELIGLWDTLNPAILNPSLDPFEQIALLDSINKSRVNPKANLEFRLRPGFDSSKLTKYFVGNITAYPEFSPDTATWTRKDTLLNGVRIVYYRDIFKPKIIPQNIFFRRGDLYNQRRYYKTINRFNTMGAWRLVNIEQHPRKDQDTADFVVKLTPANKYAFSANLEGSRNQSPVSGNLFGVGITFGLQNRNFAKAANQSTTNIRFGIELSDSSLIQTKQFSISHNIYFPRPVPNGRWIPERFRDNFRTVFSFTAGNTERKDLYNLTNVSGSWGYEFQRNRMLFTLRIPNIEYAYLKQRAKLKELIDSTPSLANIFTDGLVSSIAAGMTITGGKGTDVNIFRTNAEMSGFLTGLIKSDFLDSNLYRYIKVDAEFVRKITLNKSALVLRLFGGVGYEFNSTVNEKRRYNLPFFKQYFAGGPTSMRAWGLRKLGPGSAVQYFTGSNGYPERYGDIQIEANIEYRFPLARIAGVPVYSALFSDIGNVWFLKDTDTRPDEQVFNFNRLGKDIAVGIGTGLRIDFSFFVVRLDYSHKVKDPSPDPDYINIQNKWFGYFNRDFKKGSQFQLGISYPFVQ